ncbi:MULTISPECIES: nucleotidyltransferase family protein [Bifidobacterium]|uniref:nucleotidyltransferase family protein n=1 Tax=Bifidobacterium TaxID=1678 RepID=UPI001BDC4287|nr:MULTISPECIES: nucleotidyltransferase domain-containing protein [Bifidobacterium]MBT1160739.1 nucleotidyltransferase domain-containing protein [Bifidobacterium sp. SO1]MBW3077844.1 nucleotidyltransferase domain-containing protein [Bifidobacterium simiiventris]
MTAATVSAVRTSGGERVLSPSDIAVLARPLARRYGITELYLFGSMASGEAGPDSDVDFIYGTTHDDMRVRRVSNFRNDLRDAFGRDIDLVDVDYITQPEKKPYDEMIRSLFVRNVMSKPILRILPIDSEEQA